MRGLTGAQGRALEVLAGLLEGQGAASAHEVFAAGGAVSAKSAGVTLSTIGRAGLVKVLWAKHSRLGSTQYSITRLGERVLKLWLSEREEVAT